MSFLDTLYGHLTEASLLLYDVSYQFIFNQTPPTNHPESQLQNAPFKPTNGYEIYTSGSKKPSHWPLRVERCYYTAVCKSAKCLPYFKVLSV